MDHGLIIGPGPLRKQGASIRQQMGYGQNVKGIYITGGAGYRVSLHEELRG